VGTSLKLYLEQPDPALTVWFHRPDGTRQALPMLRLTSRANFMRCLTPSLAAGRFGITTAVIDSGSDYTILAERLWRQCRPGFITPLPFDAQTPPGLCTLTIAGGTFPDTLGQRTFDLQDFDLTLLTVTIIAKLAEDGGRLPLPLSLGLRGGFLDGRKVHAEPNPAAAFGQAWTVADP
jgi:hypothetical protein